ncbi:hypothetical protein EUX98_g1346 [Antrodiella citrinella]|uniref:Enoyl reductase (ER) domain-containing protein n=1 Tax=Antrodiella citrinella TaxID=2447956 RepID=A0A4S4N4N5_9APHY|nr:hypothetical protein EUX98_g1346 [Antrodiella citrinella]
MPIVKNGKVLYIAHPEGAYEPGVHSKYVEEDFDTGAVVLKGGVLVRLIAMSSDPYMRYRMRSPEVPMFVPVVPINTPFDNFSVGQIVRSEDATLAVGDYVAGYFPFANYSVYPDGNEHMFKHCVKVPKIPGVPLSAFVGVLGLPGKTAYTGWELYGKEKAKTSKTLFVSGGAGSVGLFLIQYVKLVDPHLKIIAAVGSAEKTELVLKAGADVAFNYKEVNVTEELAKHGPIDIYWDNTAGPILDAALENFSFFGLIIACGAISESGNDPAAYVRHFGIIFQRCITVKGFLFRFGPEAEAAAVEFDKTIPQLVVSGKITHLEDRFIGLKEAERALESVHSGKNFGKAVVIVGDE